MAIPSRVFDSGNSNSPLVRTHPSQENALSVVSWFDSLWFQRIFSIVLPLLALVSLTAFIRSYDLDLRISRWFFDFNTDQFPGLHAQPWVTLYNYGPYPGMALGIGSTLVFAGSYLYKRLRPYREPCVLMALLLVLGPCLIVNGILKPLWDRPRPCELVEFGGNEKFVPVLNLERIGERISKSFPSGHASIGFYLLAPAFVLAKRNRRWAITFLLLGLSFGLAMGLGRVAQGRHFASDVLWAAACVYFTGLLLSHILPAAEIATSGERLTSEEPAVLRIDDYRDDQLQETDATQTPDRDASERRVA